MTFEERQEAERKINLMNRMN